jgi:hypothetical protein
MKTISLLAAAGLFAAAGAVLAQPPGGPGRPEPDASETRQQAIDRVEALFARLDADHDGRFTLEEARALREARRGPEGGPGMAPPPPGAPAMAPPPPGAPEGPGRGMGMGMGMGGMRMFGEQGYITLEQMRARALERFDRADANHDGILTPEERRAAREAMRRRFEEGGRNN